MKYKIIKHKKFVDILSKETRILIIGTFNPDYGDIKKAPENKATFFYGRPHNFLWSLLPKVIEPKKFRKKGLKDEKDAVKIKFALKHKICFVDLIAEIKTNNFSYSDTDIDNKISKCKNIIKIIKENPIQEVYFTRNKFSGIKNIENKIKKIEQYCKYKKIKFVYLDTPARNEGKAGKKLKSWKKAFGKR